ncbi:Gly-Xaa carboxypeptidase [Cladophialophora chaetospira]|uniref:Gly-Xaa carboxypeptidase n=1 Tax=Cladophialophora chaetospira TaxID=386627 RepID=A0AA38X592_9EURO|nr:Gly-Xaa carboxypeptidase [Cladophialophora chaetospira]
MVLNRVFSQPPTMHPRSRQDISHKNVEQLFRDGTFQDVVAHRLADSVKIPTITYDGMGHVGKDDRWDVFFQFSEFLEKTFPRVYEELEVETVNEHALLYTWRGTREDVKPLLFMAHSDVVPAGESTTEDWTYPPFSGHYDGEFIWGRGSEDDKSNLIAMLTAIDCLLKCDFTPNRTVIVSVGFDEEGGAEQSYGARCLAEKLLERYGNDGVELIFDEGIASIERRFGTDFALPATAEKGYIDVTVAVSVPGGHSSTPPDHTASTFSSDAPIGKHVTNNETVGFLAQVIRLIEDHPFKSQLVRNNPTLTYLRQAALYSKQMPEDLRQAVLGSQSSKKLLDYMDQDRERRAMIRTSTAVDVIQGGDKVNSLPENASILVNHRIAIQDSVKAVKDYYVKLLSPWAQERSFKLHAFGAEPPYENGTSTPPTNTSDCGDLRLSAHYELESSPVSSAEDSRFALLAGTIKGVFGDDVVVAPEMLTGDLDCPRTNLRVRVLTRPGNTDTRYYWDLSSQIYRMSPWRASHDPRGTRMHTVDERMPIKGLMEMVHFYHEFIRIVDEVRTDEPSVQADHGRNRRESDVAVLPQHGCVK